MRNNGTGFLPGSGASRYSVLCLLLHLYTATLFADGGSPNVEVTEHDGTYVIKAVAMVDVSAVYVRSMLTDFVHIYRMNPSIIESETVTDEHGVTYVRTVVLGCAGYFCKELERVEKVSVLPSGSLLAEIIPQRGSFLSGRTLWHVEDMGERSKIIFESEMKPDFYIPPFVGRSMVEQSTRREVEISFANLERISKVFAERDWKSDYVFTASKQAEYTPCYLASW